MSYSNSSLQIHGVSGTGYPDNPDIYMDFACGNVTRSGDEISVTITKASLNGISGPTYFGYNIEVSAQLDNGDRKTLFSKPNSPSQWNSGAYAMSSNVTLTSTNTTTSCSLKIYFASICGKTEGGCSSSPDPAVVQTLSLSAPAANVTVTFNLNGGTRTGGGELTQSVAIGGNATPPTCERTGYKFTGWDKAYTNITSDTTITAQWERLKYTVTFNLDGGTRTGGGALSQTIYYGKDATPPICSRTQCNFVGWEGTYTNVTSNRTITAIWDYVIIYDTSELYYISLENQIKHKNQTLTLYNIDLSSENPGKDHVGWATSKGGSSAYALGGSYTANAPATLYPAWRASTQTFKVIFDLRGGTSSGGGALSQTVQYGHSATPPANPKKEGRRFSGWLGDYTNVTSDRTIYALWDSSPLWIFTGTEWVPFAD